MKTNNLYFKEIVESLYNTTYSNINSTLWYLKKWSMYYGNTYTGCQCMNKYLKDIAISNGWTDDNTHHYNNYYLKYIAESLTSTIISGNHNDNHYLHLILDHIATLTYDGVICSSSKDILSFADKESTIITAILTLNGAYVSESGVEVELYKNGVLWDTLTTDGTGKVQKTYNSNGDGDIEFSAKVRTFVSETYIIEDCYFYGDMTKIKSTWANASITDRTSYISSSNYQNDITMEWKYKNNIPQTFIGFGVISPSYDAKGMMILSGSIKELYYHQTYANQSRAITISPTVNTVFKIQTENLHTLKLYADDSLITSQETSSSLPLNVRIDDFNASPTELEYLKIKPVYSINVTVDNPILSYEDSTQQNPQTATLTATIPSSGSGKAVEIYKDNVLIDTKYTDNQGKVSYTYTSQGVGNVVFKFKYGNITGTTTVRDVHYYANYDKIKSTWTKDTSVSGRTIYNYLNAVDNTTVEFKIKNVPTSYLLGIGKFYNGGQIKSMMFNNNGTKQQWYSTDNSENITRNINRTITNNTVFKFVITNTHTISFYIDDVLIGTDNCRSGFSNTLRIDDFTSTPLDLDYVIIQ